MVLNILELEDKNKIENIKQKIILVTGCTGFIGFHVV